MNDIAKLQKALDLFGKLSDAQKQFILGAMDKVVALDRQGRREEATAFLTALTEGVKRQTGAVS